MARKLFQRKANTFQVSVGEEGAVVVYTQSGYAKSKLFVKSPEPTDTEKLRELGAGRKQIEVARWEDQVTVVVNHLEGHF